MPAPPTQPPARQVPRPDLLRANPPEFVRLRFGHDAARAGAGFFELDVLLQRDHLRPAVRLFGGRFFQRRQQEVVVACPLRRQRALPGRRLGRRRLSGSSSTSMSSSPSSSDSTAEPPNSSGADFQRQPAVGRVQQRNAAVAGARQVAVRAAAQHQVVVLVSGQIDGRAALAGFGHLQARALAQRHVVVAESQVRAFQSSARRSPAPCRCRPAARRTPASCRPSIFDEMPLSAALGMSRSRVSSSSNIGLTPEPGLTAAESEPSTSDPLVGSPISGASRSTSLSCFGCASWMSLSAGCGLALPPMIVLEVLSSDCAQLDFAQQDRIGIFVQFGKLALLVRPPRARRSPVRCPPA